MTSLSSPPRHYIAAEEAYPPYSTYDQRSSNSPAAAATSAAGASSTHHDPPPPPAIPAAPDTPSRMLSCGMAFFEQLGAERISGDRAMSLVPVAFEADADDHPRAVGCGAHFSAALTAAGDVYQWGTDYDVVRKLTTGDDHGSRPQGGHVGGVNGGDASRDAGGGANSRDRRTADGAAAAGSAAAEPAAAAASSTVSASAVASSSTSASSTAAYSASSSAAVSAAASATTTAAYDDDDPFNEEGGEEGGWGSPGRAATQLCRLRSLGADAGMRVVSLACGRRHCMVLTEYHSVYTWGCGFFGRLGHDSQQSEDAPRRVDMLEPSYVGVDHVITAVACGGSHSAAVTASGAVYLWGFNRNGQCGWGGGAGAGKSKSGGVGFSGGGGAMGGGGAVNLSSPHLLQSTFLASSPSGIRTAVLGRQHTALIDYRGYLLTFGSATYVVSHKEYLNQTWHTRIHTATHTNIYQTWHTHIHTATHTETH